MSKIEEILRLYKIEGLSKNAIGKSASCFAQCGPGYALGETRSIEMWKTLRVYTHSNDATTATKPMTFSIKKRIIHGARQELIRTGVLPENYDFEAHKKLVPMQPGDVPVTYADTSALERDFDFKPVRLCVTD